MHKMDVKKDKGFTKDTKYCVETAGFIPLEVKLKQFEQSGLRAQFSVSEFDSQDYRDMFLGPNTSIYPGDTIEEIEAKIELQEQFRQSVLNRRYSDENVNVSKNDQSEIDVKTSAESSAEVPRKSDAEENLKNSK